MKFYFNIMKKCMKSKEFTKKEKTIIFVEWFINFIIKLFGVPFLLLGLAFACIEIIFDFLQDLCNSIVTWFESNELSLTTEETKEKMLKKFKKSIDNKIKI